MQWEENQIIIDLYHLEVVLVAPWLEDGTSTHYSGLRDQQNLSEYTTKGKKILEYKIKRKRKPVLSTPNSHLEERKLGRQCGSFCLKSLNLVFQFGNITHLPFFGTSS